MGDEKRDEKYQAWPAALLQALLDEAEAVTKVRVAGRAQRRT
jgi:hypothetical protein